MFATQRYYFLPMYCFAKQYLIDVVVMWYGYMGEGSRSDWLSRVGAVRLMRSGRHSKQRCRQAQKS